MRGFIGISFLAACFMSCAPMEELQVTSKPVTTSGAIERVKERGCCGFSGEWHSAEEAFDREGDLCWFHERRVG